VLFIWIRQATTPATTSAAAICGPSVGGILSEVLPYLGIEPEYTEEDLESLDVTVPNVVFRPGGIGQSELEEQGFSAA
jgi:stage V sporulation protein D (sporulation-specific penicillin-binding protein)